MPMGKGTYGSTKGRPPNSTKKTSKGTKKKPTKGYANFGPSGGNPPQITA